MEIPWRELDQNTLERLLSEIVTRDGTDYGREERSTMSKIKAAMRALETGSAVLAWDEETETAALLTREQIREEKATFERLQKEAGIESD